MTRYGTMHVIEPEKRIFNRQRAFWAFYTITNKVIQTSEHSISYHYFYFSLWTVVRLIALTDVYKKKAISIVHN